MRHPEPPDAVETTYRVGRVTQASSRVEGAGADLLAALLGGTPASSIMVAGQSFSMIFPAIKAIVKDGRTLPDGADEAMQAAVLDVVGLAETLWSQRNAVVHGEWSSNLWGYRTLGAVYDVERHEVFVQKRFRVGTGETFSHDELDALADHLDDCTHRLFEIADALSRRADSDQPSDSAP